MEKQLSGTLELEIGIGLTVLFTILIVVGSSVIPLYVFVGLLVLALIAGVVGLVKTAVSGN